MRYDRTTILFHWLTAALVISLWCIAQVIDWFPKGFPRTAVRSTHIVLGVTLAAVLLLRLVWRATKGRRLPPADAGWLGALSHWMHAALYLLLAAVVLAGLGFEWTRGDSIFGLFQLVAHDADLRRTIGSLHGTLANIVLIAAGLHALAAIGHHLVLRDAVLRRMLPER